MKKLKQISLMSILMLGCVFTFIACSDDDDKISSPIVGTWSEEDAKSGETYTITFNSNGSVTSDWTWQNDKERMQGTYSVSDNMITIVWTKSEEYDSTYGWSTEVFRDTFKHYFFIDEVGKLHLGDPEETSYAKQMLYADIYIRIR